MKPYKTLLNFILAGMLIAVQTLTFGQNSFLDSLQKLKSQQTFRDTAYVDLLNVLSFHTLINDPIAALEIINEARQIADSLKYNNGLVDAYNNKGNSYFLSGLYEHALQNYLKAISYENGASPKLIAAVHNNLGEVFKREKQYDSAYYHYMLSWKITQVKNLGSPPSLLIMNLGELYELKGQIDSASYYYNLSLENAIKEVNKRYESYALFGKGKIAWLSKSFDSADFFLKKSLTLARTLNDHPLITQILLKLSEIPAEKNIVLQNLNEAIFLSEKSRLHDLRKESYYRAYLFYQKIKLYQVSNAYLERYQRLTDSLYQVNYTFRIQSFQEALKREMESSSLELLAQKDRIQLQRLRNQSLLIFIFLITLIFLTLVTFQSIKNVKQQRKLNESLNEINRLSKLKEEELSEKNSELYAEIIKINKLLSEGQKTAKMGSWDFNLQTGVLIGTEETSRLLGCDNQTMDLWPWVKENFAPQQFKKLLLAVRKVLKTKESKEVEVIYQKSLQTSWFLIKLVPEIKENSVSRLYGSILDISTRAMTEIQDQKIINSLLQLASLSGLKNLLFYEFLSTLLENSAKVLEVERASFWLFDKDGSKITCTHIFDSSYASFDIGQELLVSGHQKYFEKLSNSRSLAIDNIEKDTTSQEMRENYLKPRKIKALLDSMVRYEGEKLGVLCFEKRNEKKFWSLSDQRYTASVADQISNAYASYQRKQMVREKEHLIQRLTKRNKSLQDFTYLISHNLRGPVAQILGISQVFDPSDSPEIIAESLRHIKESAKNLDSVIRDLSYVLKNQENEESAFAQFESTEIISLVIKSLEEEIKRNNAVITVKNRVEKPVFSNRAYFFNILYNLISNGIKYKKPNQPAQVSVSLSLQSDDLLIIVKDDGLGFAVSQYKDKVFKMYQRFHDDVVGSGIGLYIVKTQVELLGGNIDVESKLGKGSTFTVRIPLILLEKDQALYGPTLR